VTSDETLELLESAVALRVEGREVPERVRRSLAAVESRLTDLVGPLVRKRVAARLLGCSVQALDRWIEKGAIPVQPSRPGSTHMAIPTNIVVDLAAEQRWSGRVGVRVPVEPLRERYRRDADVRDAHNLCVAIHQIAAGRRHASTA
jgi:hypothetical protein